FVALTACDPEESRPIFAEALRIARQIDDRVAQFYLLGALGCHAASSRRPLLAAQLLGAAETIRTGAGASVNAVLAPLLTHARASAIAALGTSKYETEVEVGKHLSRAAAVGLALGEPAHAA